MVVEPESEATGIFEVKLATRPREILDQGSGNVDQLGSVPVTNAHGFLQPVASLDLLQHVVRTAGALDAMLLILDQPADVAVGQRVKEETVYRGVEVLRLA